MPKHMDRLTSIDASFLAQERDGSHMHIGGIMIFEGPAPPREEFAVGLEERLHLVPRYRQKLSFPRFEMGRPLWVDDPSFNLGYHVRHTALPAPTWVDGHLEHAPGVRLHHLHAARASCMWQPAQARATHQPHVLVARCAARGESQAPAPGLQVRPEPARRT